MTYTELELILQLETFCAGYQIRLSQIPTLRGMCRRSVTFSVSSSVQGQKCFVCFGLFIERRVQCSFLILVYPIICKCIHLKRPNISKNTIVWIKTSLQQFKSCFFLKEKWVLLMEFLPLKNISGASQRHRVPPDS